MDSTRTRTKEHRRCPENAEIFPTDQVNETDKFGSQTQNGSVQVRWFGQDVFRAPDSGISYSQDHRTQWAGDDGEEKDSGHPMGSQLMGRKRRAGDRFAPSRYEVDIVHQTETRWDIPRYQNRRGTGSGESSSAYETVGVYFHASSQIFWKI